MKPWITLGEARSPDGEPLVLQRRDTEVVIRVAGQVLMTSRITASERALAAVTAELVPAAERVLVGGLGLGFTLRAMLDALPATKITVAEMSGAIVDWNRAALRGLNGAALEDPRVKVEVRDVASVIRKSRALDAIVLDVDNGPSALSRRGNRALYAVPALREAKAALRPGGLYVVWSAGPDPSFGNRLREVEFDVLTRSAGSGGSKHVLFIGRA
jgi:spermidine synthase